MGTGPPQRPHDDCLRERRVAGFETLTPKVSARVGGGWRTTPMFGVYFFARILDQWRPIERALGVAGVVKVGTIPAKCPDQEIARLLERFDADGIVRLGVLLNRSQSVFGARSRLALRSPSPEGVRRVQRLAHWHEARMTARSIPARPARRQTPGRDRRRAVLAGAASLGLDRQGRAR